MRFVYICVTFTLLMSSCLSHKELISFQQIQNMAGQRDSIANQFDLRIQPEDLLNITVQSFDPDAVKPFNAGVGENPQFLMTATPQNLELFTGYFVDKEGYIDFPVIGRVQVGGMTLSQARETLVFRLQKYLKEAVVNIRFFNFKVTVLGEVLRPGAIKLSTKRVTILEAIGLAGDLTSYANRNNILLIREKDGQRVYNRLSLQQKDLFTSPYFFLQQNDIIYIEPISAKTASVSDQSSRLLPYTSVAISLITLLFTIFKK